MTMIESSDTLSEPKSRSRRSRGGNYVGSNCLKVLREPELVRRDLTGSERRNHATITTSLTYELCATLPRKHNSTKAYGQLFASDILFCLGERQRHQKAKNLQKGFYNLKPNKTTNEEPRCRICSRLTPPPAFNPRTPESRYKSSVTRRREYDPRRYDAKVGTDLKSELDSRFYNVGRIANKVQELKRNIPDYDGSKYFDRERSRPSADARTTDLKSVHNAVQNCTRELEKIKTFLEDENTWWKILKDRSATCCEQTLPHLHGILDGSSVTLILFEEGIDEVPHRFATAAPNKRSNIVDFRFRGSSRDIPDEADYRADWKKYAEEYRDSRTVPYAVNAKSAVIEAANAAVYDSARQIVETTAKSNQSVVATELWVETHNDKRSDQKAPEWPGATTSKETCDKTQPENKDTIKTDRSNIAPSREIWYGEVRATFEDALRPRETFSSENTASVKRIDFESNVDLSSKLPSRNITNHKLRTRETSEKNVHYPQKSLPTRIPKIRKD